MLPVQAGAERPALSLLEQAASRLTNDPASLSGLGEPEREELAERLEAVSGCVQDILDGRSPHGRSRSLLRSGRDARLIHALRAHVLHIEVPAEEHAGVLALLRALETLLVVVTEEDPEDLQSVLSQPDAFELLVEVAHDLRSPLTSILFLSETLRGGLSGELNDVQKSQMGLIYSAALGLVSVASDVMDLARYEGWWVDQGAEAYSVQDLLQSVEEMVRPMAEEKRIELLLSSPHYDRAYGHPIALNRVLLNLTTNAIKFTDKGFVELGAKRLTRQRIEYYVRDTGRGISPELQGELFRPMKMRPSGDGHFFSGSGLGLSISRRIVRSLGSDLQFETAADWGTRFFFLLDIPPLA